MHEYFLQIIEHLKKKGYKKLNPDSNNVYGRADEEDGVVYVVVVGSNHNLDADSLRRFNNKIYFDISKNTGMRVELLNLLITPDGMFDSAIQEMLMSLNNIWLFSEDYGRLYIFENQPQDFDCLYEILDKQIEDHNHQTHIQRRKTFGVITPILLLLNLLVFALFVLNRDANGDSIIKSMLTLNLDAVFLKHQYYRIISAMFFHFDIMHLLGNMILLIALGSRIENVIGKIGFLTVYMLTGIVASISSLLGCYIRIQYDTVAGGASGAVFGLLGIMIIFALFNKGRISGLSIRNLILLSVLTLLNGYVSEGIDNEAHLGGLLAGLLLGIIIILFKQNKQKVVKDSSM